MCVSVETAAARVFKKEKEKRRDVSILPLDQIQALVSMNSMLVLLEQAADVICP